MNWFLNEESLRSSNRTIRADYEVACAADNVTIAVPAAIVTTGTTFQNVMDAARAANYKNIKEKYLIFLDDTTSGSCGQGEVYLNDTLSTSNPNNGTSPMYSVVWKNCWTGGAPMHELTHNMGAVQNGAPDSNGRSHCNDGEDVMCYDDSGSAANTYYIDPSCPTSAGSRFDCNKDTYFDTQPESGEWLNTHWNVGSTLNRFLLIRP